LTSEEQQKKLSGEEMTDRDTVMFFGYLKRQRGVNRLLFMSNLDKTSSNGIQYGKGDLG